MTDLEAGYDVSVTARDERYGVVNGHNTRCASLLGQGCDCRDPFGGPQPRRAACPTRTPEVHELGEFPMTCYRCHVEADS